MTRTALVWLILLGGCVDPEQYEQVADAEADVPERRDQAVTPDPDARAVESDATAPDAAAADAGAADGASDGAPTDAEPPDGGADPDGAVDPDMADPVVCEVHFEVGLPQDTPEGPIYLAGTFQPDEERQWQPGDPELAMARAGGSATATLRLSDGESFDYKYTRGAWERVEVGGDCGEIPNRATRVACVDGRFDVVDVVAAWSDACR